LSYTNIILHYETAGFKDLKSGNQMLAFIFIKACRTAPLTVLLFTSLYWIIWTP